MKNTFVFISALSLILITSIVFFNPFKSHASITSNTCSPNCFQGKPLCCPGYVFSCPNGYSQRCILSMGLSYPRCFGFNMIITGSCVSFASSSSSSGSVCLNPCMGTCCKQNEQCVSYDPCMGNPNCFSPVFYSCKGSSSGSSGAACCICSNNELFCLNNNIAVCSSSGNPQCFGNSYSCCIGSNCTQSPPVCISSSSSSGSSSSSSSGSNSTSSSSSSSSGKCCSCSNSSITCNQGVTAACSSSGTPSCFLNESICCVGNTCKSSQFSCTLSGNSLRTAVSSSGNFYCDKGPRCIDGRKARCRRGFVPKCVVGGNTKRPDCCKKRYDPHVTNDPNSFYCKPELLTCRKNTINPNIVETGTPFCVDGEIMCDSGKPYCDGFAGKPACKLIQGGFIIVPGCKFSDGFNANAAKCIAE